MAIFEDRKSIVAQLTAAGFKPAPRGGADGCGGDVHLSSSDGVYFYLSQTNRDIQLVVLGAMHRTPIEMAEVVNDYWVKSTEFLAPAQMSGAHRQAVLERSFISIILRHYGDEPRRGTMV